jgi:hypothetical protein
MSITRNFTGGANPGKQKKDYQSINPCKEILMENLNKTGRSQFGSTSEMVAAFQPRKVSWNMHTGLAEQVEVLEDPESQWKPNNAPRLSGENPIPHSRLETWLRGTDEMRGKLFLATSVLVFYPNHLLSCPFACSCGIRNRVTDASSFPASKRIQACV